jgi:hypothetical protein
MKEFWDQIGAQIFGFLHSLLRLISAPREEMLFRARNAEYFDDSVRFSAIAISVYTILSALVARSAAPEYFVILKLFVITAIVLLMVVLSFLASWKLFGSRRSFKEISVPVMLAFSSAMLCISLAVIPLIGALKIFSSDAYVKVLDAIQGKLPGGAVGSFAEGMKDYQNVDTLAIVISLIAWVFAIAVIFWLIVPMYRALLEIYRPKSVLLCVLLVIVSLAFAMMAILLSPFVVEGMIPIR